MLFLVYIFDTDLVEKRPEGSRATMDPYVAKKTKLSRLQELPTNLIKGDCEVVPKGVNEEGEEELWVIYFPHLFYNYLPLNYHVSNERFFFSINLPKENTLRQLS